MQSIQNVTLAMSLSFQVKAIEINGYPYRIVLQSDNGPCALIALCNVLLLSPQYARYVGALSRLVETRTDVGLDELITTLANIGMQMPRGAQSDVNRLLELLPQLHTGLTINPVFNGSFEDGDEMALFRLFNVSIVHGWVADYAEDRGQYEHVSKYSYEGAQRALIDAYDIQHGSEPAGAAGRDYDAQALLEDATYIKSFLARSATQLTDYGLHHLRELLLENSYAVLFRNDHFSTIIKHNNELYALVTDLGFKDDEDIVWQSLKSVNGSQDTFYSGRFIPSTLQKSNTEVTSATSGSRARNPFLDPTNSRADAQASSGPNTMTDEQYARQLQEQEDARVARSYNRQYNAARSQRRTTQDSADGGSWPGKKSSSMRKRDKLKKKCIIM